MMKRKKVNKKELTQTERQFGVIKKKVDIDEFIVLEKRVAALEKAKR